jgi:hypothetical protein
VAHGTSAQERCPISEIYGSAYAVAAPQAKIAKNLCAAVEIEKAGAFRESANKKPGQSRVFQKPVFSGGDQP